MNAPLRACSVPGCPHARPCPDHNAARDKARGTSTQRLYDYHWQKYRAWFIKETNCKECGRNHALCEECQREGRTALTFAVDHIEPHRGDIAKFWAHANHQGLCETHHNRKSQSERMH